MYANAQNEYGCPLYAQTGAVAVQDFECLLANLPPELRAAFEQERAARQAEINSMTATHDSRS